MSQLWTEIASWWLRLAFAGGLLLLAGLLLIGVCRQPVRKLRVGGWTVAIALLLLPMTFLPGWLKISLPVSADKSASVSNEVKQSSKNESATLKLVTHNEPVAAFVNIPPVVADVPKAMPEAPAISPVVVEPQTSAPPPATMTTLLVAKNEPHVIGWVCNGLIIGYCAIVVILLGRLMLGHLQLIRLWRTGRPASAPVRQAFGRMTCEFHCQPALRVSNRVLGPMCFGIIRPRIVVPEAWANVADERALRWIFAHELSHLERRDPLFGWLLGFAQSLFFLWPWFWKLRREVRLSQEYLADASAVQLSNQTDGNTPAEDYADFLVRLTSSGAIPLAASGAKSPSSDLYRRITMLLKKSGKVESTCPRRWSLAAGFALLALGLIFTSFQVSAKADPADPAKKAEESKKAEQPKKESVDDIEKEVQKALDALRKGTAAEPRKEKDEKELPARNFEEEFRKADEAMKKAQKDMAANPNDETRKAYAEAVRTYQEAFRARIQARQPRVFQQPFPLNPLGGDPEQMQKMVEDLQRQMAEQMKQFPQFPGIGGNGAPADMQRMMEAMQRQMAEQMRQMQRLQGFGPGARIGGLNPGRFGRLQNRPDDEVRLGVRLEKPNSALVEQLDLPANKGMVVTEVVADSSAAKAGIKTNDIIFEIGGKTVPSDAAELHKIINEFKANDKVDVVLVRKGKKTTIKDVVLPEAKEQNRLQFQQLQQPLAPQFLPVVPNGRLPQLQNIPVPNVQFPNLQLLPGGDNTRMSVTVVNGEFTIKFSVDGVNYTVEGNKDDRAAKVTSIKIVDGDKQISANSIEKLDDKYKPTVEKLLKQIR